MAEAHYRIIYRDRGVKVCHEHMLARNRTAPPNAECRPLDDVTHPPVECDDCARGRQ